MARLLSNAEMCDLPDDAHKWHNFSEDPNKYYVSFGKAWEVNEDQFNELKDAGCLCIKFNDQFIVVS